MLRSRSLRPVLLLIWFLPSCYTYRASNLAPSDAVAGQKVVVVRLAGADTDVLRVKQPSVRGDSLGGTVGGDTDWIVPLASVAEVRTRQKNVPLTAWRNTRLT